VDLGRKEGMGENNWVDGKAAARAIPLLRGAEGCVIRTCETFDFRLWAFDLKMWAFPPLVETWVALSIYTARGINRGRPATHDTAGIHFNR